MGRHVLSRRLISFFENNGSFFGRKTAHALIFVSFMMMINGIYWQVEKKELLIIVIIIFAFVAADVENKKASN